MFSSGVLIEVLNKTLLLITIYCWIVSSARGTSFDVVAFYTARNDQAHISFVEEAHVWFARMASENNFTYTATSHWDNLNPTFLADYEVVIFLDTRPERISQRLAFEEYMNQGGAWMGFHFAAFALDSSAVPNDWIWYQEEFLGCGQYVSNTWRPTSAILRVENHPHPATQNLHATLRSSPNEWYRWEKDLRQIERIQILLSIDPVSFPLGTGPKSHEIWHTGDYPVVWTNTDYRMIYFNMGHNDIDYENGTNETLSFTFKNPEQNVLVLNSLLWLGKGS